MTNSIARLRRCIPPTRRPFARAGSAEASTHTSVYRAKRLVLTPDEQTWLHSLPPLQVGFDSGWPPFSYLDDAGHPGGIAAEYLDYLSRTLGVQFTRAHSRNWPATIEAFQRGDLAILATSSRNDPRLKNAVNTRRL